MRGTEIKESAALVAAIENECVAQGMVTFPWAVIAVVPLYEGVESVNLVRIVPNSDGAGNTTRINSTAVVDTSNVKGFVQRIKDGIPYFTPCFRRHERHREGTAIYWWTFESPPEKPKEATAA